MNVHHASCCKLLQLLLNILLAQRLSALLNTGLGSDDEVNLVRYLFHHGSYNHLIRPVQNLSDVVVVNFGLAMIQLIHVEEKSQIMKSNVWLRMNWTDYQLTWAPEDYGGITVIRISARKVWKPDIVLFNNADGKYEVSWQPNILVSNNGDVMWIPPAIYKSSCTIDVTFFPFDTQDCKMKFGSWTFDSSQVVLSWFDDKGHVDLTDYWKSGTWDILKCPGNITEKSKIEFSIELKRKTLFYTVNLIIPCVLISFLSVCVFYLPADAGEKMTLCISILLALVVFLLLVSKILPPTSKSIPLISKFLLFTFIMNIFTIIITVIIINWNFRSPRTHKMPRWVYLIFMQSLPLFLFMKRPEHVIEEERRVRRLRQMTSDTHNNGTLLTNRAAKTKYDTLRLQNEFLASTTATAADGHSTSAASSRHHFERHAAVMDEDQSAFELHEVHHPHCRIRQRATNITNCSNDVESESAPAPRQETVETEDYFSGIEMTMDMRRAISAINFIATHLRIEDEYNQVLQDWKYVASVIDRVQLIIFVSVTISGTLGILLNAPDIFTVVSQDEVIKRYSVV